MIRPLLRRALVVDGKRTTESTEVTEKDIFWNQPVLVAAGRKPPSRHERAHPSDGNGPRCRGGSRTAPTVPASTIAEITGKNALIGSVCSVPLGG